LKLSNLLSELENYNFSLTVGVIFLINSSPFSFTKSKTTKY